MRRQRAAVRRMFGVFAYPAVSLRVFFVVSLNRSGVSGDGKKDVSRGGAWHRKARPFPLRRLRAAKKQSRKGGGRERGVSRGRKARKKGRCVPPLRNRKRKDPISPRAFSTPRKGCRRVWSRDWAGIPARTRPRCPQAGRSPRRRSLRGFPGRCRRKWRTVPRQ